MHFAARHVEIDIVERPRAEERLGDAMRFQGMIRGAGRRRVVWGVWRCHGSRHNFSNVRYGTSTGLAWMAVA
jgi:hypothetical protein